MKAKKHFGQHFLNDFSVVDRITEIIQEAGNGRLLEIGPGQGVLTALLFPKFGDRLWAAEIDRDMIALLKKLFPALSPRLLEGDVLRMDWPAISGGSEMYVVGNFPYNISSQIVFKIIDHLSLVSGMTGMFQREMARRVVAPPGNKDYGVISVFADLYFDRKYHFEIAPEAFSPPPKVQSAVIELTRKKNPEVLKHPSIFKRVVKTSFQQRRKMLRNSLGVFNGVENLPAHYLTERPEQLHWQQFDEICGYLS